MTEAAMEIMPMDIREGVIQRPYLIVMHGPGGVGKSTFAMQAGKTIFSDIEEGTFNLPAKRLPKIQTFENFKDQLKWIRHAEHDFKTYCADGMDQLELLIQDYVVRTKTTDKGKKVEHIDDFGWGRGYSYCLQEWNEIISELKEIREQRNMNVILIAHSEEKMIEDVVRGESYKRLRIKLNQKVTNLLQEQADCVLFATHEVLINKDKYDKVTPLSEGKSIIYTEYRPQWDAKNRLGLPFELPLDWESFKDAAENGRPESPESLKQSIEGLLTRIEHEEVKKNASSSFEKAGDDVRELMRIKNKLVTIVEQRKE